MHEEGPGGIEGAVRGIVASTLQLGARGEALDRESRLLGAIPEFDSMAVVTIVNALEEHFGFVVDDDELDASVFESIGSLSDFVVGKLEA